MRRFNDGDRLVLEPWRARAFPVIKDLVVDRSAFDRIIQAGGYSSINVGGAPDGNAILIPKMVVEQLLDMHKISSVRLLRILCALVAQRLREIDDKLVGWYILSGGSDAPEVR